MNQIKVSFQGSFVAECILSEAEGLLQTPQLESAKRINLGKK
jgi:hypothetical protein